VITRPLRIRAAALAAVTLVGLPAVLDPVPAAEPGSPGGTTEHTVDGLVDDWRGRPTMVPGTASYDGGEWSFTDYPYDDIGTGSFAYPEDRGRYGDNAADPVVVHVAVDADAVHYLVRLSTLIAPDTTVVALAVDTDGDEATGGGMWPHGAKAATPGWDIVVTAWGTGGDVTFADGRPPVTIEVAANTVENVIELAVPRAVADPASGTGVWRHRGGAGVWDVAAGTWAEVAPPATTTEPAPEGSPSGKASPDHPNVFNLLFRSRVHDGGTPATDENDDSGAFQARRQGQALASGDLDPFFRDVDFSAMATGATIAPEEPPGDVHITRVYESAGSPNAFFEGRYPSRSFEGMDIDGTIYNGRYQPYRLFVPATYRADPQPAPLLPLLHGWGGDHKGFNPASNAFWNDVVRPNRALVAKVLGAGNRVWYEHLGELDVLQVIEDVKANYAIDDDRVYLGGVSMGGLGTVKIAEAHPDLFAGIFPSVPPMSDRAAGYAVPAANDWDLVEHADSLRNVPVLNSTGTYDALVPAGIDSDRFCNRLMQLGYEHDCWRDISAAGTHRGYDVDRAPQLAHMLANHRRVVDPARVTYEVHPVWLQQAVEKGIDDVLTYDRAYWASGITYRPGLLPVPVDCRVAPDAGTCFGQLDVRTFGRGEGDPVATPIEDDPSPTLIRRGLSLSPGEPIPARNHFEGRFANLASVDLDLARMGLTLRPGQTLTAELSNAGVVSGAIDLGLVRTGASPGCTVTLDGVPVVTTDDGRRLVAHLTLTGAGHQLVAACLPGGGRR
jgi:predicted esterase